MMTATMMVTTTVTTTTTTTTTTTAYAVAAATLLVQPPELCYSMGKSQPTTAPHGKAKRQPNFDLLFTPVLAR